MNRDLPARLAYLLLGIACVGNGVWLLVDPAGWNELLRMTLEDFGDGELNLHLLRKSGAAYIGASAALFWCLVNPRIRSRVHPVLTLWFLLLAAIHVAEIGLSAVPSHRWVTDAPLVFLPPLVLLMMMIPLPRLPQRGREQGRVKWFDARKGFGFVVRDNGQELFVHFRSIRGRGHRSLREQQRVSFRIGQGSRGPQAEDVEALDK